MGITKKRLFETLCALGGKKKDSCIDFIKDDLLIRHIDSGVKYTVKKVNLDEEPCVIAYRYYGPGMRKKIFIKIVSDDFKKYEPVWGINGRII